MPRRPRKVLVYRTLGEVSVWRTQFQMASRTTTDMFICRLFTSSQIPACCILSWYASRFSFTVFIFAHCLLPSLNHISFAKTPVKYEFLSPSFIFCSGLFVQNAIQVDTQHVLMQSSSLLILHLVMTSFTGSVCVLLIHSHAKDVSLPCNTLVWQFPITTSFTIQYPLDAVALLIVAILLYSLSIFGDLGDRLVRLIVSPASLLALVHPQSTRGLH